MESRYRSGFWVLTTFVCIYLFAVLGSGQKHRPKNVQVALRSKWEGTPLLLEAGELLSRERKEFFWEFLELWTDRERNDLGATTARNCLSKIIESGRSLLSRHLASIFEFSLLLRSASPRLVLYRQLARESLSSFPLSDDTALDAVDEGIARATEETSNRKVDPLYMGMNPKSPSGQCCWVDTGGFLLFDVSQLSMWLESANDKAGEPFQQPEHFEFDHIYFNANISSQVAVLYGAVGTDCFREFHTTLVKAAKEGKAQYVLRPVLPYGCETLAGSCGAVGTRDPINLGGYGVELAMKDMEYKAMDDSTIKKTVTLEDPHTEDLSQELRGFIFSRLLERKPELTPEIKSFRDNLLSFSVSDTLDVWELKDLGHQTAQKMVHASDPLQSMREINQNFPSMVSSLSRMKLNESVKDEILANQQMIPPGKSLMALNGALVNIEDIDLYLLIDLVHQELSLADQFSKLKIPASSIQKLLSVLPNQESSTFRIDFRSSHVHYLNNLEKDPMYKRWRSNVNEILMPAFPGQLRYIRKNLFTAVFIIDPSSRCGLEAIDMIINFYENQFPIRLGLILYSTDVVEKIGSRANEHELSADGYGSEEDISSLVIRLFLFIEDQHGIQMAFKFLSTVNRLYTESGDPGEDVPMRDQVEEAFIEVVLAKTKSPPQDILLKLEREKNYEDLALESSLFVLKLGLAERKCCLLMNGLLHDSNEDALINAINEELPKIQQQVYYGHISSETDVLDKFLSESGISRYNPQILTDGKMKPKIFSLFEAVMDKESFLNDIVYLHSLETVDDVKPVTHLVSVDVTSKMGIKLLREGIHYLMDGSERARIGVLFGPPDLGALSPGQIFVKLFEITASSYRKKGTLNLLDQLCALYEEEFQHLYSLSVDEIQKIIDKMSDKANTFDLTYTGYKAVISDFSVSDMRNHLNKVAFFLYNHLGVGHRSSAVITNGRVIQVTDKNMFLSHDFFLLELLEFKQRIKHILEIIDDVKWQDMDPDAITSDFISDVIMVTSSSIGSRDRNTESARFDILHGQYSAVVLHHENSSIHIDAVVDPLSTTGQKLASLLQILSKYVQPSMRIVLNPLSSMVDLPLKNFYRYVVPSMDDFSNVDYAINGPKAFFANMPSSKTLTMNLDVPEPWLVEPIIAVHDLDNILLENLGETRTLQAVFELEAIVLTGHCFEKDHEPPRGLQMVLGTKSTPHLVDTLVMANLGYWQMKVSPGIWYLQLAPGRSSELYLLKEDDGSGGTSLLKRIIINDLRGKIVHLEVVKRKGKEHEKLLSADSDSQEILKGSHNTWNKNIFKWASGLIAGSHQPRKSDNAMAGNTGRHGKPINIFSIASGHLYERFLKIMILSVLKNTKRPVKFWFIKNYLSPQFKDVIPRMAEEYGFDYELVTYKWPTWLHKQTEKQRIIWAYKILFLDVIFPLSLEKVIFVDADQVVRADMGELYDMDIKGRPYAYTPFCDNNKDMDGYRFWRQGFWKDHLRGRPYHISALYVVDLVKFRQTAAGDTLRVFYETLSKDPNSLSNLDQDLPNYAQHTVPIFSLPQEWLWCESWCGNVTKSKAKTIDLCNNPMTKEPKLQGARRIVTEWPELDSEARQFTAKILGEEIDTLETGTSSDQLQGTIKSNEDSSKEDLESRAEL